MFLGSSFTLNQTDHLPCGMQTDQSDIVKLMLANLLTYFEKVVSNKICVGFPFF